MTDREYLYGRICLGGEHDRIKSILDKLDDNDIRYIMRCINNLPDEIYISDIKKDRLSLNVSVMGGYALFYVAK